MIVAAIRGIQDWLEVPFDERKKLTAPVVEKVVAFSTYSRNTIYAVWAECGKNSSITNITCFSNPQKKGTCGRRHILVGNDYSFL